jgi:urea transport system permease protein
MRLSIRALFVFIIGLGLGSADLARAAELETLLPRLNDKGFSAKIDAVQAVAATGDERAVGILEALADRRLYIRKSDDAIVIGDKDGRDYVLSDPLTGESLGTVSGRDVTSIRTNNRLRGVIRDAIGGLSLRHPDPDRRIEAADDVFGARNAAFIPVLEAALADETDSAVAERLKRALAATRLFAGTDTDERLQALDELSEFAEPDIRSLLGSLVVQESSGEFREKDEAVRIKAQEVLESVEERLALWSALGNVFHGISLGSVLLLAAVGLAITFGVMGVINLAHGELVMLGAYTTFVIQEIIRNHAPFLFDYSLLMAVPAAFIVAGAFGIAIERCVIRFLYGRALETLLATWGLSLILQQMVRTIFGPTNQEVGNPSWMSGAIETSTGLVFTYNRIWIIVFSLVVIGALALLLRKTSFGLTIRAVTQNRPMAASMGIRTGRVDALTFGLGSGIAGVAGVALSQIDNVSPNLGQTYIIDSFMVVVFGGVGSLWGTLVGAYTLGITNKFLEPFTGAVLAKILVLVAIILFIQKRPRGLFALKGRAVEG